MKRPHSCDPLTYPSLGRPSVRLPSAPAGRFALPAEPAARLGCDAVGTPREHGAKIMNCLPRVGCVFADELRWWWIVPAGSDIGVTWPPSTSYAVGARLERSVAPPTDAPLADPSWRGPRPALPLLIHRPDGDSPYTPPLPLYFLVCRLAGSVPHWSPGVGA
ncbi:hypothetical protein [Streptomyces sp. NPDC093261]|uniref:hypothetical protein n=1 Tax=Streptomyces sp. NPDC093261 TaxID=3366037 RepID=UPI003827CC39